MTAGKPKSVDEYIASQPPAVRGKLEQVREAIRRSLPHAEEILSYGMPAYRIGGHSVLFFAGWKQHFSIYPAGDRLLRAFAGELAQYEVRKATIRFPLADEVPEQLIERIARFNAGESGVQEQKPAPRG